MTRWRFPGAGLSVGEIERPMSNSKGMSPFTEQKQRLYSPVGRIVEPTGKSLMVSAYRRGAIEAKIGGSRSFGLKSEALSDHHHWR